MHVQIYTHTYAHTYTFHIHTHTNTFQSIITVIDEKILQAKYFYIFFIILCLYFRFF